MKDEEKLETRSQTSFVQLTDMHIRSENWSLKVLEVQTLDSRVQQQASQLQLAFKTNLPPRYGPLL